MAVSDGRQLSPDSLKSLLRIGRAYAHQLDAVTAAIQPSSSAGEGKITEFSTALNALATADSVLQQGFGEAGNVEVGGLNLRRLLGKGGTARWNAVADTIGFRISSIGSDARQLVAALNVLPRLTTGPGSDTVLVQAFEAPKRVTLTVERAPRFGTFSVRTAAAGGGGGDKAQNGNDSENGLPSVSDELNDTVATVSFDVYRRYWLHLTAGLVYSPLQGQAFRITADTLDGVPGVRIRETERSLQSVFPAALLSYTLYPFNGKISDARARSGPSPQSFGLAMQGGVSLVHPDQDIFLGLSTEPFPGVNLGLGRHYGHVERTGYASGAFVPDSAGPPSGRRWRHRTAASVSFDPAIFAATLLTLFK
jgi:hypothetical protein